MVRSLSGPPYMNFRENFRQTSDVIKMLEIAKKRAKTQTEKFASRASPIYAQLGWRWAGVSNHRPPNTDEIKREMDRLIDDLGDNSRRIETGGLIATWYTEDYDEGSVVVIEFSFKAISDFALIEEKEVPSSSG